MQDQEFALALLAAVLQWEEWCFRRVDSIHFFDRDRGQQRHSMDCLPPPLPELAYNRRERRKRSIAKVAGPLCVPLALLKKGPMRRFDMRSSNGESLPVLGASETTQIVVDMLCAGLMVSNQRVTAELRHLLEQIVGPRERGDQAAIDEFLKTGRWRGKALLNVSEVPLDLQLLIERLVGNFLLLALVPAKTAGRRQVLKFSFYTSIESRGRDALWGRFLIAVGIKTLPCHVEAVMPSATASYHLEFNAPVQIDCAGLFLEDASGEPLKRFLQELRGSAL